MLEEIRTLNPKFQAFLWMVARSGDVPETYLSLLPSREAEALREPLQEFLAKPKQVKDMVLSQGLGELNGEGAESLFYHAHPAWISETFKGESPRVWAFILQLLPKPKVGGVLKDFSKDLRRALRDIPEVSFPKPIQEWMKQKIEGEFPSFHREYLSQDEVLEKIGQESLDRLESVIHELGLSEMALAFSQFTRSSVKAILNRLNYKDAKDITKRIKKGPVGNRRQQRDAQLHLLELELEKLDPNEIIKEIGFSVLGRAFGPADQDLVTYFFYRFPPRWGYLFKRYAQQYLPETNPEAIRSVRERILDAYTRIQRS